MSKTWTREGALALIESQMRYLQANKHAPCEGMVWFGRPVEWTPHWVRAHIESLHLIAAYVSEHPEPGLVQDLEQGLLAFCASHKTDGSLAKWAGIENALWGGEWQSAWWTYRAVRCLHEAGDHISKGTREKIRRVTAYESSRFIGIRPPTGVREDTKMEENAWDAPLLAWASFVFPDHPDAPAWESAARDWAFNAATTERDRTDMRLLEHQPVAKWYAGPTLHPDYSCENHGTFHPNYQACIMQNGITASAYELHGRPVPPSVLHHMPETAAVLTYYLAPDSTQMMITGNDWPTFHGLHSCIHLLAHYTGDPHLAAMATANLDRCKHLLDTSENGHVFGTSLRANEGNWEFAFHTSNASLLSDVIRILPLQKIAPKEDPPHGSRIWHYVEVISDRDAHRIASAAWRTLFGHPVFTFLPLKDTSWACWAPWSGLGRLALGSGAPLKPVVFTHEEHVEGGRFRTEGVVHWRDEKGAPLIRQEITFHTDANGSAHYSEKLIAEAEVTLAMNQGFTISIANDLQNGSQRTLAGNDGSVFTVKSLAGSPQRIDLGRVAVLDGTLLAESDRDLVYYSPGERLKADNGYLATQFDRLLFEGRTGKFHPGEEIRFANLKLQVQG